MFGLNLVVLRAQSPSEAWLAQARFLKHSRFLGSVTASGSVRAKHTTHCWKKENPGGEKWSQAKPIKKRWVTGTRIQKTTMCCDRHRQQVTNRLGERVVSDVNSLFFWRHLYGKM